MPDNDRPVASVTVLRCRNCSALDPGPRSLCPSCHCAELVRVSVPGTGRLVSWTTIRRAPSAFRDQAPYHVAVIDLDAGVRMTARLLSPAANARLGGRVACVDVHDGIPLFRAVEPTT